MTNTRRPDLDRKFQCLENNLPSMPVLRGQLEAWEVNYPDTKPTIRYVLTLNPGFDIPRNFEKAQFILDDAESLKLYYVAGYSDPSLLPFKELRLYIDPVSAGSSRYLGPSKTFHLDVTL